MDNDEKKKRWAKSLEEAGLLDEMKEGWVLPDKISPDTTINVESSKEKEGDVSPDDLTAPFAIPVASMFPDDEPDPDKTPISTLPPVLLREDIEKRVSKAPVTEVVKQSIPSKARATMRFKSEAPPATVDVHGTKISISPDSSTDSQPPPPQKKILDNHPNSIGGRPISVAPDSISAGPKPQPKIIDDHPSIPDKRISKPHKFRDSGWFGDGTGESVDAMDLVQEVDKAQSEHEKLRERFDVGDYSGALELSELLLNKNPTDKEAIHYRDSAMEILMQMYASRIGSFDQVPVLAISPGEIVWHNLNPSTGFVLSRIDGTITFEDIIDISGLSRFETCRILCHLLQEGLIE
ncbi:MAG: hypothetical protein GY762_04785 [Proteobacteria bacterium]|nr:hypothetical protein [Pseudomonadota bacterium]